MRRPGFSCPPRAPDLLAGRLADLLCDPALLARFGAQALTRARALYTWRRVVADIASIYDEVVHQLPRPQVYWPRRPNKAIPVLTAEGRL